jgi:16S rRNA (cytidine1402-2'-O)-methyltransferase
MTGISSPEWIMPEEKPNPTKYGRLFVVATPIGNLEDISLRALRVLEEAFIIACEDTRQTVKILNKYNITKKLWSYFHPQEQKKIPKIIGFLKKGKDVALVSDAGTPGIADPGYPLIREALAQEIDVIPVPGPSAVTTALSAAGLPTHRFLFLSFPPPKKGASRKLLESLKTETATLIFYLPSRKLSAFLIIIQDILGDRRVVIARELTKVYEEFLRGTPTELLNVLEKKPIKGELTILVEGRPKKSLRI